MKSEYDKILENKFKEAYVNHLEDMPGYEDMNYSTEVDIAKLIDNKKLKKPFYGLKIAGIVFAFLLCSSLFGIAFSNGSVEAGKDRILDFINSITGNEHKVSNEPVEFEILHTNDTEGIQKAKDLMPELFIKDKILDNFIFDNMTVNKFNNDDVSIFSQYFKDDVEILISQDIINDETSVNIGDYSSNESYDGGKIYILNDSDMNTVYYIKGNYSIQINSTIDVISLKKLLKEDII